MRTVLPIAYDGSRPASRRMVATMADVVVLPCAPATATPREPSIRAASACDRCSTFRRRARAAESSGLSSWTALEITTVSAPLRWAASWPTHTWMPSSRSAASASDSAASEPCTGTPRPASRRATTDMPAPPMPIMWTRPSFAT